MKDKILFLILGILIGAVITAACFLVIGKTTRKGMRNGDFRPDKSMMENFDSENMPENMKKGRPSKDNASSERDSEKAETANSETTEATE